MADLQQPHAGEPVESVTTDNSSGGYVWNCRFHPFNWWHEVGCPHKEWTPEQLADAEAMRRCSQQLCANFNVRADALEQRLAAARALTERMLAVLEGK